MSYTIYMYEADLYFASRFGVEVKGEFRTYPPGHVPGKSQAFQKITMPDAPPEIRLIMCDAVVDYAWHYPDLEFGPDTGEDLPDIFGVQHGPIVSAAARAVLEPFDPQGLQFVPCLMWRRGGARVSATPYFHLWIRRGFWIDDAPEAQTPKGEYNYLEDVKPLNQSDAVAALLAAQPFLKWGTGSSEPFLMSAPVFDAVVAAGLTGFDLMPEMGTGKIRDGFYKLYTVGRLILR